MKGVIPDCLHKLIIEKFGAEKWNESLDDAVNNWKEMYNLPLEKEGILKAHLSKMLEEDDETLCLKRKSKSAMIWWNK